MEKMLMQKQNKNNKKKCSQKVELKNSSKYRNVKKII